jgi:hypothetical protein
VLALFPTHWELSVHATQVLAAEQIGVLPPH